MNVVLLVVDSLRACSLRADNNDGPGTPFLRQLERETICFRRAYATECWTLPSHCSMFTGLLPSEHGAHFQTMGYTGSAPTIAELLTAAGYETELVTRNFVFDGTIPGITRGFQKNTRIVSNSRLSPVALFLALNKPRVRRHIRATGFFHPFHRQNRRFATEFARSLLPADEPLLHYALDYMTRQRRRGKPYFLFCNLYDVHAPYPPTPHSILQPFRSVRSSVDNLLLPAVMKCLGAHTYLRPGFHLSDRRRRMLLERYHRAIELMDHKLAGFVAAARAARLLDDTLLILTSDHGEAFGEHGLYLHDASVYNTHLHVPLWIHHPARHPEMVDDVVSTRDLFGLMCAVGLGDTLSDTILAADYRAAHPVALAEHFYYPQAHDVDPRFRQNLAAAIARDTKIVARSDGVVHYDLDRDPDEVTPMPGSLDDFRAACGHAKVRQWGIADLPRYFDSALVPRHHGLTSLGATG